MNEISVSLSAFDMHYVNLQSGLNLRTQAEIQAEKDYKALSAEYRAKHYAVKPTTLKDTNKGHYAILSPVGSGNFNWAQMVYDNGVSIPNMASLSPLNSPESPVEYVVYDYITGKRAVKDGLEVRDEFGQPQELVKRLVWRVLIPVQPGTHKLASKANWYLIKGGTSQGYNGLGLIDLTNNAILGRRFTGGLIKIATPMGQAVMVDTSSPTIGLSGFFQSVASAYVSAWRSAENGVKPDTTFELDDNAIAELYDNADAE